MCFSANASFATAALTGGIGIFCLARAQDKRHWLLAAMPLFFSLQQSIEGALWLALPVAPDAPVSTALTFLYLLFAQAFWPVYVPVAAILADPFERDNRLAHVSLLIGMSASVYLFGSILERPYSASIVDGHVVYATETSFTTGVGLAYLTATSLPLIQSTYPVVRWLGGVVLVGFVVTYAFYLTSFASVWCFFAAAASAVLMFHFARAQQPA